MQIEPNGRGLVLRNEISNESVVILHSKVDETIMLLTAYRNARRLVGTSNAPMYYDKVNPSAIYVKSGSKLICIYGDGDRIRVGHEVYVSQVELITYKRFPATPVSQVSGVK